MENIKNTIKIEFILMVLLLTLVFFVAFFSYMTYRLTLRMYTYVDEGRMKLMEKEILTIQEKYAQCEVINLTIKDKSYELISVQCVNNFLANLNTQLNQTLMQYFAVGFNQGYTTAVYQVLNNSQVCKPFNVFLGNLSVDLINVECLVQSINR